MLGELIGGNMTHTFEIDIERGILRESFVGVVDFNALKEANAAIIADPIFQKGLNFLTDLRRAEINMGYEEMLIHTSNLPDFGIKKQAFIVGSDLEFGMSRMFETLSEDKDLYHESCVFNNLEEGLEWLSS